MGFEPTVTNLLSAEVFLVVLCIDRLSASLKNLNFYFTITDHPWSLMRRFLPPLSLELM